jgi:putative methionine-R-sulfoxide reductase with GAF domain
MADTIETQIFELASSINSSLDTQTVLDNALRCAEEIMEAEASSIFLIDEKQGDLYFHVARGESAEKIKQLRIKIGQGVAGWVARTGESVIVPDAPQDPRFNPEIDAYSGFHTRSILCVPLKNKGRLVGVVEVLNKRTADGFDPHDLEMLTLLANHIAIALENAKNYQGIEMVLEQVVTTLSITTEIRDPYTAGHQRRVAELVADLGREMGFAEDRVKCLRITGLLHDIGKIVVPAEILSKPGKLSDLEMGLIKMHSQAGHDILQGVEFPWDIATMVLQHHEHLDGSGYPAGLRGEAIMPEARVLAVADVVEAMASHRPYRPGLGLDKALEEINKRRGVWYEERVVDACLRLFERGFQWA